MLEQKIEGFKILHQKTKKNQEIFEFTGQFLDSHFFEYLKKNSEKGDLLIIYDVILNVEHTKVLCNPIQLSIR